MDLIHPKYWGSCRKGGKENLSIDIDKYLLLAKKRKQEMLKMDKIFAITEDDKMRLAVDRPTNLNMADGEEEKKRNAVDRQNICNCRRRKDINKVLQIDKIYCENWDTEEAKITVCYK